MSNQEINALNKGYKYFIEKINNCFLLYLRNNDSCGNSYSGDFDYHYYYKTYREAKKDAILLSQ